MKRRVLRHLNFQSLITSTLLLYYVFKGVSWPPHYDDEPWIWSEAINYLRGDRDHKTILGSEVDTNPIFSLISKLILMVSPLDFWQSMRLSSMLLATLFCVFSLLSLEKLSGIRFRYTFLLLFFLNPLFDVLLYGRLEAFALAFAWSSILALLYRRLTLSALLFSLALSIHPLVVALIPMHLMAFKSTWEKFNTKLFSFSLSLLVFMILFNASLLTNFSNYINLLRWTGTSSTVFSDQFIV